MSKAIYHQAGRPGLELDVSEKNKDGTVNLARDGVVLVTSCQISKEAVAGTCTLVADSKEKAAAEKAAAEKAAAEKAAAEKAAAGK